MLLLGSRWRERTARTLASRPEISQLRYAVKYLFELVQFLTRFSIDDSKQTQELSADDAFYFTTFKVTGVTSPIQDGPFLAVSRNEPRRRCSAAGEESLPGFEEWVQTKEEGSLQFEVLSDDLGRFKFAFSYSSDVDPINSRHLEGSVQALARGLAMLEEPGERCSQIVFAIGSSAEYRVP